LSPTYYPRVPEREFTDAEIDRALEALTQPGRFREAESRVLRAAPQIQRVLNHALQAGGFFDEQHDAQVLQAATMPDDEDRLRAVRTLVAEEARMGMLIGVAVGWELARELEQGD
jgi:hypothetical protein